MMFIQIKNTFWGYFTELHTNDLCTFLSMYFTSIQKQNCCQFLSETIYIRIPGGEARVEDTALHLCCCVPFRKEDLWLCVWVLTTCASEWWAEHCRLVKRRLEDPVCRWLTARMALWGWGRGCSPAVTGDPPRTLAFRDCLQPPSVKKWFLNLISSSLFRTVAASFHYFYLPVPLWRFLPLRLYFCDLSYFNYFPSSF